jgi:hypothetical protein
LKNNFWEELHEWGLSTKSFVASPINIHAGLMLFLEVLICKDSMLSTAAERRSIVAIETTLRFLFPPRNCVIGKESVVLMPLLEGNLVKSKPRKEFHAEDS